MPFLNVTYIDQKAKYHRKTILRPVYGRSIIQDAAMYGRKQMYGRNMVVG